MRVCPAPPSTDARTPQGEVCSQHGSPCCYGGQFIAPNTWHESGKPSSTQISTFCPRSETLHAALPLTRAMGWSGFLPEAAFTPLKGCASPGLEQPPAVGREASAAPWADSFSKQIPKGLHNPGK